MYLKSKLLATRGAIKMAAESISCFPGNFDRKKQCRLYEIMAESYIFSAVGKALSSEQKITRLFYIILDLPREMQDFCHSHLISQLVCFYPGRRELTFSLLGELVKRREFSVIHEAIDWSRKIDPTMSARLTSLISKNKRLRGK
ncbi:MAG: hypothetical protein FJZ56_06220 [Chlamydiae bacterium]|nr:hypothetical protein [Chlamydiota bacterium]